MAEFEKKGTVTPFNTIFTSAEAEKAARKVEDAIADRQKELSLLRAFISDNSALIHHVQKLPDELSHQIMVPFGGAAFFPGRLIHTNEFLVLGEGYYAERSAKQAVEILQRRGKSLEAHVESLNGIVKDLEVEAKFFDSTAAEVAEGLVEMREEYVEENRSNEPEIGLSNTSFMSSSKEHNSGVPDEEDEDAKIMARLDELEKEEEEAVSDLGDDEDDETASSSDVGEVEDDENASYLKVHEDEDDEDEDEDEDDDEENVNDNAENISETDVEVPVSKAKGPGTFFATSMHNAIGLLQHPPDQSSVSSSKMQIAPEGSLKSIVKQPQVTQHPSLPPETREYLHNSPPNIQNSSENILSQSSKIGFTERKAFTGTVIEHSSGLLPAKPTNDSASGQPSRPVSRFKIQKDLVMEERNSNGLSSGEAVLLGALASGVNGPTWFVLKITFMMLAICLIAMLSLAFISSDFIIVGHVILLVIIGAVLFVLLNGFLAQTGLVSVEQQVEEMGISQNDRQFKDKKK